MYVGKSVTSNQRTHHGYTFIASVVGELVNTLNIKNHNNFNLIKTTLSKTVCSNWVTKGIISSIKIRNKLIRKKHSLGLFYKSKFRQYITIFVKIIIQNKLILFTKKKFKIQWKLL